MSGRLREACGSVSSRAGLSSPRLPDTLVLEKLALEFDALPAATSTYKPKDPRQLASEIAGTIRGGGQLSRRQIRQAPWCLWTSETQLAQDPDLLQPILEAITTAERASPFRSLASAYVDRFDPTLPGLDAAARCLIRLSALWGGYWGQLQDEFGFFDPEVGPRRLAAAVIDADQSATEILRARGVQAMAAQGGYVRAVTAALLEQLAKGSEPDHLQRLDKIRRYALSESGSPLFGDQLVEIAEALLRPFERLKPEKHIRDRFLEIILRLLSDPRLRPGKWTMIPPALKNVVTAWLTEQSLRQFLDIVEQTTERLDMFRYRRAFWQAAYEHGFVEDAWVAFGSRGRALARTGFGQEVSCAELFQQRKPVDPGHAVLLMRVGHGMVADWSHMGMCNIWLDDNDPTAPRLFELRYGSNAVQIPDEYGDTSRDAFSHVNPAGYTWQRKAADYLFRMTGRRLPSESYRVR